MGVVGFIFSLVSAGFMIIGLIPFLGLINWFTTLPAAIVGVVLSAIGLSRSKGGLAVPGLVIGIVVIVIASGRLIIGCGII
jgi:hypothetical protein